METAPNQLTSSVGSNSSTSFNRPQPVPTPAPTSAATPIGPLQRAYTASLARESPSAAARPSRKSPSPSLSSGHSGAPKTAPRTAITTLADVDENDLFSDPLDLTEADNHDGSSSVMAFGEDKRLWREGFSERPEPVSSRAKKSAVGHLSQNSNPSPMKKLAYCDEDDFPDIDDLIPPSSILRSVAKQRAKSVPAETESPCPRPPTGLDLFGHSSSDGDSNHQNHRGDLGLPRTRVEGTPQPAANESDFATSSRKRKTPSSPSLASQAAPNDHAQANKKSKMARRGIVLDSDDDFGLPPTFQSDVGAGFMDVETPTPSMEAHSPTRPQSVTTSVAFQGASTADLPAVKKTGNARSGDVPPTKAPQPGLDPQRSFESDTARNKHFLGLFLARPSVMEIKKLSLDGEVNKNKEEYTQCLRNKAPKEERDRVRAARASLAQKQKALDLVRVEYEAFKQLSTRREDLLTELGDAFANGIDTMEDEDQLDELSEEISAKEEVLIKHLVAVGIDDLDFLKDPNDSIAAPDSPATAVVFATQPSRRARPVALPNERAVIPEYHSQVVLQTQPSQARTQGLVGTTLGNTSRLPSAPSFSQQTLSASRPGNFRTDNRTWVEIPDDDDDDYLRIDSDEERAVLSRRDYPPPPPRPAPSSSTRTPHRAVQAPAIDHFDDFSDDDEEMLAAANSFEQQQQLTLAAGSSISRARSVFSDASGNAAPAPLRKRAPAKNVPSKLPRATIDAALMKHPWSPDVRRALKDRFRMTGFRTNQLEAINATLAGKDAFVLMPTGGGKSLCYQLPAVINSGKTRGVTIVVSPLLSLMNDQVAHMKRLNILATAFSGMVGSDIRNHILGSFHQPNPEHFIQLLYVTPEMLVGNTSFKKGIDALYRKKKLARIVIDEAHCVSHWGHDFRPDYKALGPLRRDFAGIPVMALTATATQNVIADIKHNLQLENCELFSQSFNRPNLYYQVITKQARFIQGMGELINTKHAGQSGIVYTLSRKSAEGTAHTLETKHGIKARYFHAQMDAEAKVEVQEKWQSGEVQVVVATIAFGMGIDKPDVRFVIHQNMPKSLEGYYQETGRAGRDGNPSVCYMYFSYGDIPALRRMINEDKDKLDEEKERQHGMVNRMAAYCENSHSCRRVQLLQYFGEKFEAANCNQSCDNCVNGQTSGDVVLEDFTECAVALLSAVKELGQVTLGKLVEIVTASKNVGKHQGIPGFATCKGMKNHEVQRVVMALHDEGALIDEQKLCQSNGIPVTNYRIGKRVADLYLDDRGEHRLRLQVRRMDFTVAPTKKRGRAADPNRSPAGASKTSRNTGPPPSTNVSSPVAAMSRKRKPKSGPRTLVDEEEEDDDGAASYDLHANGYERDNFVVSDEEEGEDAFDPPRPPSRAPTRHRQQTLHETGPPISRDRRLDEAALDEIHQDIVHAFVDRAQKIEENLRNRHGLRRPIFTEHQYREMAIRWTTTVAKMYTIHGVDKSKVDQHGAKFASLVQQFRGEYQEMMGQAAQPFSPVELGPKRKKKREVVDLISDDEGGGFRAAAAAEEEDPYDEGGDQEDDEDALEASRYFQSGASSAPPPPAQGGDDAVQQWHRRFEELKQANKAKAASSADTAGRTAGADWASRRRSPFGRGRGGRGGSSRGGRGGSFSYATSTGGVSKRRGSVGRQFGKASTTSGGGQRSKSGPGSKPYGGGAGGGGGSIPSMPY
ncbi:hypothetical protein C8A05DRAFT_11347 [Staphylotrichum tortipilum]|uniref:DNA 3'-5' helicase n=1 Tax=Staphylotrichum tortipilum TaxID=2831512 RepID=A0AAN6MWL3_9PEZI|nr:hypothetical protein C8A05DRAFT_11347 [Staphylotrichum longicolle]